MKLLKSHGGAVLITALIVLLAMFFGVYRSVTAEREKVLVIYEQGVDGDGNSVASDLRDQIGVAKNLLTVAQRYLPEGELSNLIGAIRWAEENAHPDDADFPHINELLGTVFEDTISTLSQSGLSEKDADYVRGFEVDYAACQDRMERDGYNAAAAEFNKEILGRVPGYCLGDYGLRLVKPLGTVYQKEGA